MLARYAVKTMVAVAAVAAAFIGAVTATPHPECEPCAAITPVNLDALTIAGKVSQPPGTFRFYAIILDISLCPGNMHIEPTSTESGGPLDLYSRLHTVSNS